MFNGCSNLKTLNLRYFNTSNVTNIIYMFYECKKLIEIKYGENFIKKEGAETEYMFYSCSANRPTHSSWRRE